MPLLAYVKLCFTYFNKKFAQIICAKSKFVELLSKIEICPNLKPIWNLLKLFTSKTKYESGSGWPSFYQSLPDVFETKTDHLLGYARTEYHCKNCNAHHGHIFDDGPEPTGKRYCNNGVCLVFKEEK